MELRSIYASCIIFLLCIPMLVFAQAGRPVIKGEACSGDLGGIFPSCTVTDVQTDAVGAITDIAASVRSGSDATVMTGTAGPDGNCVEFDANGDLVEGAQTNPCGDITRVLDDFTGQTRDFHQDSTAFGAADTTPSVGTGGSKRLIYRTGGAVTITDFDDGTDHTSLDDGRQLLIQVQHVITLDCSSSQIHCNGGSDWTSVVGDLVHCVFDDTIDGDGQWLCLVR